MGLFLLYFLYDCWYCNVCQLSAVDLVEPQMKPIENLILSHYQVREAKGFLLFVTLEEALAPTRIWRWYK